MPWVLVNYPTKVGSGFPCSMVRALRAWANRSTEPGLQEVGSMTILRSRERQGRYQANFIQDNNPFQCGRDLFHNYGNRWPGIVVNTLLTR